MVFRVMYQGQMVGGGGDFWQVLGMARVIVSLHPDTTAAVEYEGGDETWWNCGNCYS